MRYPMLSILEFLTEADIARFWSRVDKRGPDECWPYGNFSEYGMFTARNRTISAHRIAWVLAHQEELGDRYALHSCDYKPCVNPAHLWAGTHFDNQRDCTAKGRQHNHSGFGRWNAERRAALLVGVPLSQRSVVALARYEAERMQAKRSARR